MLWRDAPVFLQPRTSTLCPGRTSRWTYDNQNVSSTSSFQESSGQYWGLAFPLNPQVLLPSDPVNTAAAAVPSPACDSCPMPLQLSRLYTNSQYQHDPGQCLKCYDVKVGMVIKY